MGFPGAIREADSYIHYNRRYTAWMVCVSVTFSLTSRFCKVPKYRHVLRCRVASLSIGPVYQAWRFHFAMPIRGQPSHWHRVFSHLESWLNCLQSIRLINPFILCARDSYSTLYTLRLPFLSSARAPPQNTLRLFGVPVGRMIY
jgi:hypothetical protein